MHRAAGLWALTARNAGGFGRELRPTHAASAAARLAGRGPSNAAPHVQIDALGIVPGPADHFVHTSPLCFGCCISNIQKTVEVRMTEVVCEFTAADGPPEFRQKAEKVKITVGSRRENFPHETSVEFKNICTRPKKSLVWTFPRRDPTGKLTFFYPAASCRNSGGPDFLSAAVLGADFRI